MALPVLGITLAAVAQACSAPPWPVILAFPRGRRVEYPLRNEWEYTGTCWREVDVFIAL